VTKAFCQAYPPAIFHRLVTLPFRPSSQPLVRWLPVCTMRVGSFGSVDLVLVRSSR